MIHPRETKRSKKWLDTWKAQWNSSSKTALMRTTCKTTILRWLREKLAMWKASRYTGVKTKNTINKISEWITKGRVGQSFVAKINLQKQRILSLLVKTRRSRFTSQCLKRESKGGEKRKWFDSIKVCFIWNYELVCLIIKFKWSLMISMNRCKRKAMLES